MEFHPYTFVMPRNESGEMQEKNFRSSREELKILPKTTVKKNRETRAQMRILYSRFPESGLQINRPNTCSHTTLHTIRHN